MTPSRRRTAREPDVSSVVYITGTYPLLTTTFIDREIQALMRRGVDVAVISARRPPEDAPLSDAQRDLATTVTYLTPIRWHEVFVAHLVLLTSRPWRFVSTFAYLLTRPHPTVAARGKSAIHFAQGVCAAHLLRRRRIDALHAHFVDRAATITFVAARLLGVSYTVSIHAGADVFVNPVLLAEKIGNADRVVSCTRYNKTYIETLTNAAVAKKIQCIPHGLDLEQYASPHREVSHHDDAPPVVLAVGQLTERKGFAQLIDACRVLRDEGRPFTCRIVGTGPQADALRRRIEDAGLSDCVELCGAMRHERVLDEYRAATMFVLPCIRTANGDVDGIPNVIAEAMALELPVVSSDLPAIRELVTHGSDGLLVPPGDVDDLVEAMRRLLDRPTLRRRLGRNARETILDTFDVQRNIQLFTEELWPGREIEVPS